MTREQLSTLRKLAEEATYGPWEWCEHHKMIHGRGGCKGSSQVFFRLNQLGDSQDRDLQFVCAANPAAILELIGTLEKAVEVINQINRITPLSVHDYEYLRIKSNLPHELDTLGVSAREFLASLEGGDGE